MLLFTTDAVCTQFGFVCPKHAQLDIVFMSFLFRQLVVFRPSPYSLSAPLTRRFAGRSVESTPFFFAKSDAGGVLSSHLSCLESLSPSTCGPLPVAVRLISSMTASHATVMGHVLGNFLIDSVGSGRSQRSLDRAVKERIKLTTPRAVS